MRTATRNSVIQLTFSIIGVWAFLFGVVMFNQYFLMNFSLPTRMVLMILLQWAPAIIPIVVMLISKDKLKDLGFAKEKVPAQLLIGIGMALIMSALLTVIPILLGLKDWVGSTNYSKPWQFIYEFIYRILGVAFAEEVIFRGFIFHRLLKLKDSKAFAIAISSALFGLFHMFGGNIVQVLLTSLIGVLWCVCREKIKNCSTLSLIIAHGIYDALIVLWLAVL